jgi:trk system potassium uptake protein TrkH
MRWRYVLYLVGILLFFLGLVMVIPMLFCWYYHEQSLRAFIHSSVITTAVGIIVGLTCRGKKVEIISQREGMAIVAIGWTVAGLFAALPFYLGGVFETFIDAFFESVSGFTTTGASVMTDVEAVPKGMLLWRSLIQWLGGMGIIVLFVAVIPFLGVGGMQLYKAEVPSPVPDKLKPRIQDTAKMLWKVYAVISIVQVLMLMAGGMGFYDALNHTFTTMPTGGFSTRNLSVAYYDSVYIDVVIIFFMFVAGINYSLHFQMLQGKTLAFWKDSECRFYLIMVLVLTAVISFNLYGQVYDTIGDSIRYGAFQVVSIVTTTGYATADYNQWPAMSQLILLVGMFIGACAGSTGGGMKCVRIMCCFKYCYKELFGLLHPRAVVNVKIGGKTVSDDVIRSILGFLALYTGLFVVCSVMLAGMGVDIITSISAVASAIGNVGPGLGMVGPMGNYSTIPEMGKWLLVWCMLLGRLEIYTVIIFLVPEFWRK